MPRTDLRVYHGPSDDEPSESLDCRGAAGSPSSEMVEVVLCEVVTVLADAIQTGRSWLKDFADERVVISRDLHEVLQEYQRLRRHAA